MSETQKKSVEFEVFGKVQGVFFRKSTQEKGKALGLRGWCRNTEAGTVQGVMEGEAPQIEIMKDWLRYTGSPASRIDRTEFNNEKEISEYTLKDFGVKR